MLNNSTEQQFSRLEAVSIRFVVKIKLAFFSVTRYICIGLYV